MDQEDGGHQIRVSGIWDSETAQVLPPSHKMNKAAMAYKPPPPEEKKKKEKEVPSKKPTSTGLAFVDVVRELQIAAENLGPAMAIMMIGLIKPLMFLLHSENADEEVRALVVKTLTSLGKHGAVRRKVDEEGTVDLLISMLEVDELNSEHLSPRGYSRHAAIAAEGIAGLAKCESAKQLLGPFPDSFASVRALLEGVHGADGAMWGAGIVRNLAVDFAAQEAVRGHEGVIELLVALLDNGINSKSTAQAEGVWRDRRDETDWWGEMGCTDNIEGRRTTLRRGGLRRGATGMGCVDGIPE